MTYVLWGKGSWRTRLSIYIFNCDCMQLFFFFSVTKLQMFIILPQSCLLLPHHNHIMIVMFTVPSFACTAMKRHAMCVFRRVLTLFNTTHFDSLAGREETPSIPNPVPTIQAPWYNHLFFFILASLSMLSLRLVSYRKMSWHIFYTIQKQSSLVASQGLNEHPPPIMESFFNKKKKKGNETLLWFPQALFLTNFSINCHCCTWNASARLGNWPDKQRLPDNH